MKITRDAVWHTTKDYSIITLGLILYAVGFCGFILPHGVITGGLAGIAALIFFKTGIPVAYSFYTLNIILLSIAYRIVGRGFVLKTIYGASGLSLFMLIAQMFFKSHPVYLEHDILLSCIIGAVLCGVGTGLAFTHNGSTGGTDIIAAVVNKHFNVSLGKGLIMVDLVIISSCLAIDTFGEFPQRCQMVVFGLCTMVIECTMIDYVMNVQRQSVQFMIFSKEYKKIAEAITRKTDHTLTILDGHGWYTGKEMKVICLLAKKRESVLIFRLIKMIDPRAFVSQSSVIGVYGEGFDPIKVKVKKEKEHEHELQQQQQENQ